MWIISNIKQVTPRRIKNYDIANVEQQSYNIVLRFLNFHVSYYGGGYRLLTGSPKRHF